jgi:hypothetical protein
MNMNLYEASNQWATRPDDQRFWTLEDLLAATRRHRDSARVATVPLAALNVTPAGSDGADLVVVGPTNQPARLTHWSFGQLARTAGAPADYLRRLPAPLAAANLCHGLQRRGADRANLLIHNNGSLVVRSATSDSYSRIWDCDVVERPLGSREAGWRVPPARPSHPGAPGARPATEADVLSGTGVGGLSVKVGDLIAPAGLYASDHDLFVFMVNESRRINDGSPEGLSRGFFISNSEVGAAALKVTTFLYRHVCGNHIVWDATKQTEVRIVHRGNADQRFARELAAEIKTYAERAAGEDEQRIASARRLTLGPDKAAVLDTLFGKLRGIVSRHTLEEGFDRATLDAQADRTIDPRTAWGMVQGLTAYSQSLPFADERDQVDRAAGKVLAMAF